MRVWMVRHGESENNLAKLWTGWMDVPLTPAGEEQAKIAGALMEGVKFDRVFASDLMRAKRTAEVAIPGCQYEATEQLREVNVGTLAGRATDCMTDEERAAVLRDGYGIFGGETREEFRRRVTDFMKRLEALNDCENVAVFSHSGFLSTVLSIVLELPRVADCVYCKNCATAVFEYLPERGWRLYSWINVT